MNPKPISYFSPIYVADNVNEKFKSLRKLEGLFEIGDKHYVVSYNKSEGKETLEKVEYEETNVTTYKTFKKAITFVACSFLLPLKLLYRWKNKEFFDNLPLTIFSNSLTRSTSSNNLQSIAIDKRPITLTADQTGSESLTTKIDKEEGKGDPRTRATIGLAYLFTTCSGSNSWDLSEIFPKRTIKAEDIEKMTHEDLLNLLDDDFLAIIDLISGKQAIKLLKDETIDENKKLSLYFFNTNLATKFALKLRSHSEKDVDEKVQKAAQEFFVRSKKYNPEEMINLQKQAGYEQLEKVRMTSSETLAKKPALSQKNWKTLNDKYLSKGIEKPTLDFIQEINDAIRLDSMKNPDHTQYSGYRGSRMDVSSPRLKLYYLPGHAVKDEMDYFVSWLNKEIENCDEGKSNPIVVAALAYQKFVSIHPFRDGNGRTGRMIADLILRRYELLPAAWPGESHLVALHPLVKDKAITPTQAVERIIEAIKNSSKFMDDDQQ